MRLGPVYFVTDADAPASVPDQVRAVVAAGVPIVQLRDKEASDADLAALAQELLQITRAAGAALIINDRIGVALGIGADGLHVAMSSTFAAGSGLI